MEGILENAALPFQCSFDLTSGARSSRGRGGRRGGRRARLGGQNIGADRERKIRRVGASGRVCQFGRWRDKRGGRI